MIESNTHLVESDGAEHSTKVEKRTEGSEYEERRRGRRVAGAVGDTGHSRELALKLSDDIEGCDISVPMKARAVKRINGRTCWVIKRNDLSGCRRTERE